MAAKAGSKLWNLFTKRCKKSPNNSFVEGTFIYTENGYIPIEEIQIGTKVWSWNEKTQESELQEVTHLIKRESYNIILQIELLNSDVVIETTENHPFLLNNEWILAKNLLEDDQLISFTSKILLVKNINHIKQTEKLFNLSIYQNENYYVTQEQILTHNAKAKCGSENPWHWKKQIWGHTFIEHGQGEKKANSLHEKAMAPDPDGRSYYKGIRVKGPEGQ